MLCMHSRGKRWGIVWFGAEHSDVYERCGSAQLETEARLRSKHHSLWRKEMGYCWKTFLILWESFSFIIS
jgi:hypothetical protein